MAVRQSIKPRGRFEKRNERRRTPLTLSYRVKKSGSKVTTFSDKDVGITDLENGSVPEANRR
ncbi:predicted protein [Botrytis cinerea T4]|uniref:Uncharacterized protein n=1 Tax=Botryotinia fuckeliana (strain T4) TaxID=999810 RepID=G2YK11_BOTF4|nr:predicted protein [Botrytis cinerea T4]